MAFNPGEKALLPELENETYNTRRFWITFLNSKLLILFRDSSLRLIFLFTKNQTNDGAATPLHHGQMEQMSLNC